MGCGCCSVKENTVAAPIKKPPQKLYAPAPVDPPPVVQVANKVEFPEPSSQYLYLLGVTDNKKPHLIRMDPKSLSFTQLAVPQSVEIYNYSNMICIGPDRFLVSGGISVDMSDITSKCFILEPLAGKAQPVPKMNSIRYTHIGAYYRQYVYVFGGRQLGDDDEAIIKKSERFSLRQNKWEEIPPLKVQRCTGFSLVWKDRIYVFGGYTSEFKRSKAVEIFDPVNLGWSYYQWKLPHGLQCGSIAATTNPNEFVLFGGNMKYGPVNTVSAFNIQQGTVHTRPSMKQARVLQKSIVFNNSIYIFGGCENDNIEVCDLQSFKWTSITSKLSKLIPSQDLDFFAYGAITCQVSQGSSKITKVNSQYNDQTVFLFGTDSEPFVLEFNVSVPYAISHPVPMSMRCFSYQGGVSIPNHKYILMGGITDDLDQSTDHSYEFDGKSLKARRLPNMAKARYSFSTIYNEGFVYVLGGRNQKEGVEGLMDECQRFNIAAQKWEKVGNLPIKCVSSCAFAYKKRVYVTGGYTTNEDRNVKIYLYEEGKNAWKPLQFQMPFGIEASALLWASEKQLLFFGGRVYSGDIDSVWKMVITDDTGGIINAAAFVQVGNLSETKSLHKVYHPRHQEFAVVFGGSLQKASFYNLRTHRMEKSDILSSLFGTFEERVRPLQDPSMKKYLLLS